MLGELGRDSCTLGLLRRWDDKKRCKDEKTQRDHGRGEAISDIRPDGLGKLPGGSQAGRTLSIVGYEATWGRIWVLFVSQKIQMH